MIFPVIVEVPFTEESATLSKTEGVVNPTEGAVVSTSNVNIFCKLPFPLPAVSVGVKATEPSFMLKAGIMSFQDFMSVFSAISE